MEAIVEKFLGVVRDAAGVVRAGDVGGHLPEQAFRRRVEAALPEVFGLWGITFMPSMERATVTKRRIDMLCGRLVTEYKAPGVLASLPGYEAALEQTRDYIEQLSVEFAEPLSEYFGIVLDGEHVGFVHHDPDQGWLLSARAVWGEASAIAVLERFRAHSKHPLDAGKIAESLGPSSMAAKVLLPALVGALRNPSGKTALLFSEWQRLFGQAVGTEAHQYPGVVDWAQRLGVVINGQDRTDLSRLFFSLHTYYALVIKVLTADIVGTIRSRSLTLFAQRLQGAARADQVQMLRDLENNRLFEKFGISNFMEGDFFSWYLEHFDGRMGAGVSALAEAAAQFEPSTPLLSPSKVTDLYKRLYQGLVPERIRHDLGEFYTPDWLADYVLERVGFAAAPKSRVLDPACGSGTFLVRAVKLLKASGSFTAAELIDHIRAQNIAGFDLNPLAVIAARANLILALIEELAETDATLTLPVFLADSIYSPELESDSYVYRLETERGTVEMRFPASLVASDAFNAVLREVEGFMWEDGDKPCAEDLPADSLIVQHGLLDFYRQIWELDEQEWNKIWCRIINNRFAAVVVGHFDFVVGNPPWVVWSNLPASYRDAVKHVCDRYNIFSDDAWVGGIESDISTVMTYAAADRWLRHDGALGFVITQSVYKTKSAQGFRRFKIPGGADLKVFHVDDMVALRPFEDAANRTATLFLRKGSATTYPVPYLVWKRQSRRHAISSSAALPHIIRQVHIWAQEACPVSADGGAWITAPAGHAAALLGLLGGEGLHARKGTTTDFNNIYWVTINQTQGDLVEVENNHSEQGHQVPREVAWIEKELVYPLARGQEIGRFSVSPPGTALILPQRGMRGFDAATMARLYPNALRYFRKYKDAACSGCRVGSTCRKGLEQRGSYANPKYRGAMGEYWAIWNVGPYTFAPFKVAWKEVSSRFEAAVLSMAEVDGLGSKLHIPDHKLMFQPCQDEYEAHFICGALNSGMIRNFAEAVSLSTSRGTRIFEELNIPPFDASNPGHALVAQLSMSAHAGTREMDEAFDDELDVAVAEALGQSVVPVVSTQISTDSLTGSLRAAVVVGARVEFPRSQQELKETTFVAMDVETTGFSAERFGDRVVEIAAVRFSLSGIKESWSRLIWPGRPISVGARKVHGITLESLEDQPTFADVWDELRAFLGDAVIVAHNADFDSRFLCAHLGDIGVQQEFLFFDTLQLLRAQFSLASNRLAFAMAALGVEGEVTHAALADATATAQLMLRLCELLRARSPLVTLGDLASLAALPPITPSVPLRADPHLALARAKADVAVVYRRGEGSVKILGKVDCIAKGEEGGYLTLRVKSGRRLLLRLDLIENLEIVEERSAADSRGKAPLRIVRPLPGERYVTCVPLVPLKAAAGAFSDQQHVEDDNWEWVAIDSQHRLRPGMFVAQVVGKSMEPTIPDGSYCLFAVPVAGTRQGKTVLVQMRDLADPETGERYTIKRYESEKVSTEGSWRHAKVTLRPNNPDFPPIELHSADEGQFQVIAECVEVLGGGR